MNTHLSYTPIAPISGNNEQIRVDVFQGNDGKGRVETSLEVGGITEFDGVTVFPTENQVCNNSVFAKKIDEIGAISFIAYVFIFFKQTMVMSLGPCPASPKRQVFRRAWVIRSVMEDFKRIL